MPDDPTPDPDPTPEPTPEPTPDPTPDPDAGAKKALEAERKARAEAEKAAKAASTELEKLRKAQMTEQEKAVTEAEERGKLSALKEFGEKLASAEIRVALTGVVPDPAAIIEDLNVARYVNEDGTVNTDAVAALREKYAGFANSKPPVPGVPSGPRPEGAPKQLTRADLKGMTPAAIDAARAAGQLDELLGRKQ